MTTALKTFIALFATLFLSLLLTTQGYGQAKIAPIALYMSDDDRTGRIVVRNTANQPIEVSIEMIYGYPATDSEGKVYLKKFDEVPEGEPSATSWIRTYPRHTVLPPDEQQTIRFAARPPAQLSDGEYWVRPAVSVRKTDSSGELAESDENVQTSFNMVQRTILSLNYRQGNVKTGVEIKNISSRQEGNTLHLNTALERTGNAAYLGHVDLHLADRSGNSKKHIRKEIAVYHSQNPRFEFDIGDVDPGTYEVQLSLDTGERHRDNEAILEAQPVNHTETVTIK